MRWLTRLGRALSGRVDDHAVRDELQQHVELETQDLIGRGVAPAEARRRALLALGGVDKFREEARDVRGLRWLDHFRRDVCHSIRALRRTPGFTLVVVVVLSIGIGVNATAFSVANAWFLRPLPVADPDTLVRVYSNRFSNTPIDTFEELRARTSTLDSLIGFTFTSLGLRLDRDVEHVFGEIVSGDYFSVLGIRPAAGRLLVTDDDRSGAPPVVVLSYAFWQRRFGGAPSAIGRTLSLNDRPFTIVGVAPDTFPGVSAPLRGELWVPLAADAVLRPAVDAGQRRGSLYMMGRLARGATRDAVQAELDAIGRERRARGGNSNDRAPAVTVYPATMLHPEAAQPAIVAASVLMAVVTVLLLIVCVNVANLVLARAAHRDTEIAMRQALGAGRLRIVSGMLAESLVLAGLGAVGGVALAWGTTRLIVSVPLPASVPLALDLPIDIRVLAFGAALAVLTTVVVALTPALTASRMNLTDVLSGVRGYGRRHARARSLLLVAQVAMSVLLLVTAGLFIRSLHYAETLDLGFDGQHVLTASMDLETRGYTEASGIEFVRALTVDLESSAGILAAHAVETIPVTLSNSSAYLLREDEASPGPGTPPATPMVYTNAVSPGHFATLQIPLLSGRDFSNDDSPDAPRVVIVNEAMARAFWPDRNPIGQRLRFMGTDADPSQMMTVIGVARDSTYVAVGEAPRPFMYRPFAQAYQPRPSLMVRTTGVPEAAVATVREAVRRLDPGLAVFNVATLPEANAITLLPARIAGRLLAVLGLFALVLAALGIYGVLSFLVRARTREIGLRVAVGATPGHVARLVVSQALSWALVGAGVGLVLAIGLTHLLSGLLYGINPLDPLTLGGVALLLSLVAGVAAGLPAWRASRLDPLVALRQA